jgi:hypothetical protein
MSGCALWNWIVANYPKLILDLILTSLLAYPLFHYMSLGWKRRAEELKDSLTSAVKRTYLKLFRHMDIPDNSTNKYIEDEFYKLYLWVYGRKWFIAPIGFTLVVALISNFYVAQDLIRLGTSSDPKIALLTAPAAMAGAYLFVAYDFIARVQRRSLLSADVMRGGLRLALAIPLGFAFAALVKDEVGPFMAFAVGAFPLGDLLTMLRQIGNEKLNLKVGQAPTGSRVVQLLGVDPSTADRVEDADISTIPQLSTCDPVDLAMRTCLQFRFVLNMCDQACVWVSLGSKPDDKGTTKLDALRPLGLASAFEISDLVKRLRDPAHGADAARCSTSRRRQRGCPQKDCDTHLSKLLMLPMHNSSMTPCPALRREPGQPEWRRLRPELEVRAEVVRQEVRRELAHREVQPELRHPKSSDGTG